MCATKDHAISCKIAPVLIFLHQVMQADFVLFYFKQETLLSRRLLLPVIHVSKFDMSFAKRLAIDEIPCKSHKSAKCHHT